MKKLLILLVFALTSPAVAKDRNLDRWFDDDLLPYVATQLVEHPRFKGETVMFVVLENNAPAAVSNTLALALRDRLLDAALNTSGVSIGWRQGGTPAATRTQAIDCTHDQVHYYVGIELNRQFDGTHRVDVRALDLQDRNWVTGFGKSWQGHLSTVQRNAAREARADETFRGARDVPFEDDESDLLARHLAHELSCALFRQTTGSYVVSVARGDEPDDNHSLAATADLVGKNLASNDALELTQEADRVNAVLDGVTHRIDGSLHQYWLTVTPTDPEGELSTLSVSAYVVLHGHRFVDTGVEAPDSVNHSSLRRSPTVDARSARTIPIAGDRSLLGPLKLFESNGDAACDGLPRNRLQTGRYGAQPVSCSLLAATAQHDAIIFVLEHQANYGLVRLGGESCRQRTAPRLVAQGQLMRYPIPYTPIGRAETRQVHEWLTTPDTDTYYALAVSNSRAARQLANHIDQLPLRCDDNLRPGLTNNALQRWLDELTVLAARHAGHVDWRAIEIKDVL
jgi:hypothetical protein